ncbi:MAG: cellulose synthase catalytic subunit (UDP-forming) [Cyanobacteria bacterium J055]|nr:MAG: cellulose synthase catalytic subunit (UDP-forming) [Cyanobacteria bacterium J055]
MANPVTPQKLPRGQRLRKRQLTRSILFLPHLFDRLLGRVHHRYLRWLVLLLFPLSIPFIVAPVKVWQQWVVAIVLMFVGWLSVKIEVYLNNKQTSEYIHMFLVWLSMVVTLRYLYYRTSYTLNFEGWLNAIACLLLFGAELYAIVTLVLSFFQTLRIKDRQPIDLELFPPEDWFKVDIYIPTYNEDVEIVRKTAIAAMAVDYPAEKKRVYVLDDGRAEKYRARREKLQQMCDEVGCTMLVRDNNDHAKAGNINTAMKRTDGDLILILDCDHIPSRQILKHTVGFFMVNPKVALVQTPHWFYNPDPFERNLLTGGNIPVGNELFYKVLQKGNDFWNAAFFCGSAAIVRKEYLLQIGGIAVETVTEDCHTSFRLHSLGYESVYYDKIMVAGLAPEVFSSYVGQQVRWARGMAQILRLENPLINPKLNLRIPQRICYFSATSHFFYGFPRLIYAIVPTLFLLFGIRPVEGLGLETLAYALPHILIALNANYIAFKHVRFTFWNEILEFVMAYQSGIVTFMALINPKLGSFNVTDKGIEVTKRSFDWRSIFPLLIVTSLVVLSMLAVPFWLILRPEDTEAVLVNALWCTFNLILLTAAILVALEQPQMRKNHRLERQLPTRIYSEGQTWTGRTSNVSETGAQILLETWPNLADEVEVELEGDFGSTVRLKSRIVWIKPVNESQVAIAVDYIEPTQEQLDRLVIVIYSEVEEWYSQNRQIADAPLASFMFLARALQRAFRPIKPVQKQAIRKQVRADVQLYWQGNLYSGQVTELGFQSVQLEFLESELQNWQTLKSLTQLVGLSICPRRAESDATRLLAQVESVSKIVKEKSQTERDFIAIELSFPKQLKTQQETKIQTLVATLSNA